jgi:hypothetical protein
MSSGPSRNPGRAPGSPTGSRAQPSRRQGAPNPPDGDPTDSDDGSSDGYRPRRQYRPNRRNHRSNPDPDDPDPGRGSNSNDKDKSGSAKEAHFDLKLKYDNVPTWDGNTDTIVRWLLKINDIARESSTVFRQLGRVVPKRLEGEAEVWYWSLPIAYRSEIEKDWDTLRKAFSTYYMNRKWLDRQRGRANKASYRDYGHARETPSEYFIRKTELLNTAYTLDDSEIIMEVMDGAPSLWNTVLTTQMYQDAVEFQSAIRYHEDALMKLESRNDRDRPYRDRDREYSRNSVQTARTNLVGWSRNQGPPKFPKDDKNVSAKATPESKGARPCRHCGSGKHWDNECKHAFKGNRAARANLANTTSEDQDAQDEYNDLYYSLDTDDDSGSESKQGFNQPLQITDTTSYLTSSGTETEAVGSALEGNINLENSVENMANLLLDTQPDTEEPPAVNSTPEVKEESSLSSNVTACTAFHAKPALNRRTRRRLAREINSVNYHVRHSSASKPIVELRKYMARPPGCSFLGAKATETTATIGGLDADPISVIVDSGSDITLISQKALENLSNMPRTKAGQRIDLIQVTGKSIISGYITLDLFFHTEEGPVKLNVEAYIVKGMTTPFILGNDFADQYSISVMRREGESYLIFGDSGRELRVAASTSPSLVDEDGHTFKVRVLPGLEHHGSKAQIHRKSQKLKKRARLRHVNREVRSKGRVTIPAETSVAIPVELDFPRGQSSVFVERSFQSNGNEDALYGSPDMLISKDNPILHVANFSQSPVTISSGQVLGTSRNPKGWLDRMDKYSKEKQTQIHAHAALMRSLVVEKLASDENIATARRAQVDPVDRIDPIDSDSTSTSDVNTDPRSPNSNVPGQKLCSCPESHRNHPSSASTFWEGKCQSRNSRTNVARSITEISSKAQRNATEADDPLAEEPIEGGPKTSDVPEESIPGSQLLTEVDISPDLTTEQHQDLEAMILRNQLAFGTDGRLGNYEVKVEIPMKPGSEPVSLPPFPVSPANREVIDKQMDSWIQLGVIEPSKSPWAAPVFNGN